MTPTTVISDQAGNQPATSLKGEMVNVKNAQNIKRYLVAGGAGVAALTLTVLGMGAAAHADTSANVVSNNLVETESRDADATGDNAIQPQTIEHPSEGGEWSYGTTGPDGGGTVYSDYYHPDRDHGSSVINANGDSNRSPVATQGHWSHAEISAVPNKVDKAFYWVV